MQKRLWIPLLNTLLLIGVLTTNALANILPINGYYTGELSDMIPNLFVPAGVTFSIWGVIYISLIVLAISSFRYHLHYLGLTLSLNYCLNVLWILLWHYRYIFLSLLVMVGILLTLIIIDRRREKQTFYSWGIDLYLAWITIATIANVTAVFVTMGWKGGPFSEVVWTVVVIIGGGVITLIKTFSKVNIPYVLVIVWAYIGIIIKRVDSDPFYGIIVLTCVVVSGVLILSQVVTCIKRGQ